MSEYLKNALVEAFFDVSLHAVVLIGDLDTGNIVFWHRTKRPDLREAMALWGEPVGAAFGTWIEMWVVGQFKAVRCYGGPASDCDAIKEQTP